MLPFFTRSWSTPKKIMLAFLILLFLPFYLNTISWPTTIEAMQFIATTLDGNGTNGWCELCGTVLERIDVMERCSFNPFIDDAFGSPRRLDAQSVVSLRKCVEGKTQKGCDTLLGQLRSRRAESASRKLRAIAYDTDSLMMRRWGDEVEKFMAAYHDHLEAYIFIGPPMSYEKNNFGFSSFAAMDTVVFEEGVYGVAGDPEFEAVDTTVWYLRRHQQPLHRMVCYSLCEGRLSWPQRWRLRLTYFYMHYAIAEYIRELQRSHSWTFILIGLMTIALTICFHRLVGPTPTFDVTGGTPIYWPYTSFVHNSTGDHAGTTVRGEHGPAVNQYQNASSAGPTGITSSAVTSSNHGGHHSSGGKNHARNGRRR